MLTRKHVEQYIRFLETSDVGEPAEALEMGKTLEISTGMRMFDIGKAIAHMALRSLDEPGFVRVPREIDRSKHGSVMMVWNDCMIQHETLEMTWPKLVAAMLRSGNLQP